MTDAVTLVPSQEDTASTPAPVSTAAPATEQTTQQPSADWIATLDEDTRKTVEARGIKAPADAVKQLRDQMAEVTRLQQEAVKPPKDDAPKEEWDKFYARIGRPEKADGYQFKLPEGLPKDVPYDEQFASEFKGWAHATGLNPKQAQALHDNYVSTIAKQAQAQAEQQAQMVSTATAELEKAWGPSGSPEHAKQLGIVQRVIAGEGPEFTKALTSGPVMDAQGRVTNPAIVRLIAKLGGASLNDSVISGDSAPAGAKSLTAIMYPDMKGA